MSLIGKTSSPLNSASKSGFSGYNPVNGNYFGDGSNLKYDEQGRALANIKTGAHYKDNNIALGRSDEGFKTQLDYQIQNVNNYASTAKKANNQKAVTFAEETKQMLLNGLAVNPTWKFDGRSFGYSGNFDVKGREYSYDPYTSEKSGNEKMDDSTYDLMRDSSYNHYQSFSEEVWDQYFNEWVEKDHLENTTIDKQWLMSFKDYWNKFRLLNPNEKDPWGAKPLEDIAPLQNGERMPSYIGYENGVVKWDTTWYKELKLESTQKENTNNNQIYQQTDNSSRRISTIETEMLLGRKCQPVVYRVFLVDNSVNAESNSIGKCRWGYFNEWVIAVGRGGRNSGPAELRIGSGIQVWGIYSNSALCKKVYPVSKIHWVCKTFVRFL